MDIEGGDRVVLTGSDSVWVVLTVNNRVVKYFDEKGNYGQMPRSHLEAMVTGGQAALVRKEAAE